VEFTKICVLGMGYIGLPTASTLASHGFKVLGVDVNRHVIDILRNGEIHIQEPGLKTLVHAAFHSGNLEVFDKPQEADAFIIAVPTPILEDKRADMRYVTAAAESIVPYLRNGNLVMLESTSPPRTTVDLVAPILERSGLRPGEDFYLTYSPERVMPGRILQELIENARVVGGINPASAEAGRDLYASFVRGDILITDATTAEMVKLMENTYRDVNIAIANEFARLAERFGVDVWEAISLANLHPRIDILRPGPGVGGHCISVDPWFFVEKAPDLALLIKQARLVNDGQPIFATTSISRVLGGLDGRRIAALGLAYKADVDDLRESPALEVAQQLSEQGAQVFTYEPFAPGISAPGCVARASLKETLDGSDAVVLLVDHRQFRQMEPSQAAAMMPGRVAFDTRGVWDREAWEGAGFQLSVLGVGGTGD
jgi:UDP-N-acetyl-D-mannosaminuronic acid dehydrogenase